MRPRRQTVKVRSRPLYAVLLRTTSALVKQRLQYKKKKKVFPLYITFGGCTPDPTKSRTKVLFNPLATTFRSRG